MGVDWINVAHDGIKWRAFLDAVKNRFELHLHKIRGNSALGEELLASLH
jgi:hypothetical protein